MDEATNTVYSINDNMSTLSIVDTTAERLLGTLSVGQPMGPAGCDVFGYTNTCTVMGSGTEGIAVNQRTGEIYLTNTGDVAFTDTGLSKPPAVLGDLVVLSPGAWVTSK